MEKEMGMEEIYSSKNKATAEFRSWILTPGSECLDPTPWIRMTGTLPLDLNLWILTPKSDPLDPNDWILITGIPIPWILIPGS